MRYGDAFVRMCSITGHSPETITSAIGDLGDGDEAHFGIYRIVMEERSLHRSGRTLHRISLYRRGRLVTSGLMDIYEWRKGTGGGGS